MPSDLDIFGRDAPTLTLDGRTLTIAWQPAAFWCHAMRTPSLLATVALDGDVRDEVAALIVEGRLTDASLETASRALLEELSGWRWWEAERLITTSASRQIYGELALAGVDPQRCSLAQWLAAVYALLVKNRDVTERMKLDMLLSVPPRGFEDEWDDAGDDPAEVEAMMAKLGG